MKNWWLVAMCLFALGCNSLSDPSPTPEIRHLAVQAIATGEAHYAVSRPVGSNEPPPERASIPSRVLPSTPVPRTDPLLTHVDPTHGFCIKYPVAWQEWNALFGNKTKHLLGSTSVTIEGSGGNSVVSINRSQTTEFTNTIHKMIEDSIVSMTAVNPTFRLLKEFETTVDGIPAHYLRFTWLEDDMASIFLIHDGTMYAINVWARRASQLEPLESLLYTFRLSC